MKILWITNIMLPPICEAIGHKGYSVGGWMYSSLKNLRTNSSNKYAVATIYSGEKLIEQEIEGITWYLLPMKGKKTVRYNKSLERYWREIQNTFSPNVVHIHGSEYPHGLAYVNACGPQGVVVSIQGMVSCYARYYAAGIDSTNVKKHLTFRDIIKRDTIRKGQKSFEDRGVMEIKLLQKVSHIIGRTEWDMAHTWAINPKAQYHHCGETLRDSFYNHKWSYDSCEPHSIFVSQASYPIKGVHTLFEALPLVLRHYPDTKVYIAGHDPTVAPWWRIDGYGKYLKKQIARLGISKHIEFTGMLNEEAMCNRYLKSNVFVCCSAIENSPNSLGEAQQLGMPYVASFVGGVPEITDMNSGALYRFEETEMLAKKICDIFALHSSYIPAPYDTSMYDGTANTQSLLETYREICLNRQ